MRERLASFRRALWLLVASALPLWSIALSSDPRTDASPQPPDWNFQISADGVLYALDEGGKIRWTHNCTSLVLPTAPSPDWRFDDEARNYWKSLISETPFHSEQGLFLGNAATTVEVIDKKTGKLFFKFLPDGSYTRPAEVQAEPVNTLVFKQVHYSLQCLAIPEGRVNWALNFSEITLVTYAPETLSSASLAQVHGSSRALVERREQEPGILYAGGNYVPVPVNVRPAPSAFYGNSIRPFHPPLPVSAYQRPLDSYGNSTYPRVPVPVFLPSPPTTKHFWDSYQFLAGVVLMFLVGLVALLWSWFLKRRQQSVRVELPAAQVKAKKRRKRANRKDPEEFKDANFVLTGTEEIKGLGSGVYEGRLEDMPVAAKRVPLERAQAEKAVLLDIGSHPNVVNYRWMRQVDQYGYVIVERCQYDLRGWVEQNKQGHGGDEQLEKVLSLCRGLLEGIKHIHDSRYIHRDLKPDNIWIHENEKKNNLLTPKIADFATCKQLPDDYDEDLQPEPGSGTEGWRAPEQVENSRSHTRAMDMFNFACLLFFCLTGGEHPFGVPDGRDSRISRGERNTWQVDHEPLIKHLLDNLLDNDPSRRLSAGQVQEHPLFWDSEKRMNFLSAASSRVAQAYKSEDNLLPEEVVTRTKLRARVGALQPLLLGTSTWDGKLDEELVQDLKLKRKFDFGSVKDLLRAIRNKWVHHDELSQSMKAKLPRDGFEKYFRARFPALLIELYKAFQDICAQEIEFQAYFTAETS